MKRIGIAKRHYEQVVNGARIHAQQSSINETVVPEYTARFVEDTICQLRETTWIIDTGYAWLDELIETIGIRKCQTTNSSGGSK